MCDHLSVEVAGVEPASPGILMGLLRAHPAEVSQVPPRHRRRCGTPADLGFPDYSPAAQFR